MATEIAVMAITISAITSENVIYAIALTKEPTIVHPTKAIAVWNMILPTASGFEAVYSTSSPSHMAQELQARKTSEVRRQGEPRIMGHALRNRVQISHG